MSTQYSIGLLYILLAAILWSATAIIVPYLHNQYGFNSPFLVTYIGCSLFMIFLTPSRLTEEMKVIEGRDEGKYPCKSKDANSISEDETSTVDMNNLSYSNWEENNDHDLEQSGESNILNESSPLVKCYSPDGNTSEGAHYSSIAYYTYEDGFHNVENKDYGCGKNHEILKKYIPAAFKVLPLWYMSNYFYNFALASTSITSSSILSNMGCVFTFLFALMFKEEKFSKRKLIGVILAFVGSILTSLNDADGRSSRLLLHLVVDNNEEEVINEDNRKLWGDLFGFVSAIGHAGYTIVVRKVAPADGNLSISLLLGFVGLINAILLAPYAMYLLTIGRDTMFVLTVANEDEDLSLTASEDSINTTGRLTWIFFGWLLIKGVFGNILPSYFWGKSIVLTSATVATVGLNVMIPLAILSDIFIMHKQVLSIESTFGAVMVILGFALVN